VSNSTRPSSSNGYDERFVVPLEASRRGAHRARVSPVMAALPIAVVVGIVVGAIALVYLFLGGGNGDAGSQATTSVEPSPTATTASDAADATSTPSSSETSVSGEVDKTITVDVFNGTSPSVSGLARKAANKLTAAGWTTGRIETWTGAPVAQTTVYYGQDSQKASAQSVARTLSSRAVTRFSQTKAGNGLVVVVGNDYSGSSRSAGTTGSTRPTAIGNFHPTRADSNVTTPPVTESMRLSPSRNGGNVGTTSTDSSPST
jgi:hypothetical protein